MYDLTHLRSANDRLWAGIRSSLSAGPEALTRSLDPWTDWLSPKLLFSQTCSLPFRERLCVSTRLVGTPVYEIPDCPPGFYYSYLIRFSGDTRDLQTLAQHGNMAYNDGSSQSGWAAPYEHLSSLSAVCYSNIHTGSHLSSIEAVRSGAANFAAVDAVTFHLWKDENPEVACEVDVFDRTPPTPALPYITDMTRDPEPIAQAVKRAIEELSQEDKQRLRLKDVVQIPASEYLALPIPPAP